MDLAHIAGWAYIALYVPTLYYFARWMRSSWRLPIDRPVSVPKLIKGETTLMGDDWLGLIS